MSMTKQEDETVQKNCGVVLFALRNLYRLGRQEVTEMSGMEEHRIVNIENNRYPVRENELEKLSSIYGITEDDVLDLARKIKGIHPIQKRDSLNEILTKRLFD